MPPPKPFPSPHQLDDDIHFGIGYDFPPVSCENIRIQPPVFRGVTNGRFTHHQLGSQPFPEQYLIIGQVTDHTSAHDATTDQSYSNLFHEGMIKPKKGKTSKSGIQAVTIV
jgi:hypothetical protein